MTAKEIEALKPNLLMAPLGNTRLDSEMPSASNAAEAAASVLAVAVNDTTTNRTITLPSGETTTITALPDSTNLRLLNWVWAPSALLVDKPSKISADADSVEASQDTTIDGLLQLMSQAQTDLLIVSPYFVPGNRMMKTFADLRKRGVRVRVLTNSMASNDAPAAHAGYARYRKALLDMGLEIYEMRAEQKGTVSNFRASGGVSGSAGGSTGGSRASLHAKVVVMDNRMLVVGSMNLDLRSQLQNSEVAIVIRNPALSLEATRLIEPALTKGAYQVKLVNEQLVWHAPQGSGLQDSPTEPDASLTLKLLLKLFGPFAPDEML